MWTHSVASDIKPELLQDLPELAKHEAIGTNGSSNTHTTIDSITNAEQSDESNLDPSLATDQTKSVAGTEESEVPQKPANGRLHNWA